MTRRVYLVAEVETIEGFEIDTKVYTTYEGAVRAFKVIVADHFILDAIHDVRVDNLAATPDNMLCYYNKDAFQLYNKAGNECDVPKLEKQFNETCGGEVTLEVGSFLIIMRTIEEES